MDELKEFLESLMVPLIISIFGGLARLCYSRADGIGAIVRGLVVATFTGVMVHLILKDSGLSGSTQAAFVGVASWGGPKVLDGLMEMLLQRFGRPPRNTGGGE